MNRARIESMPEDQVDVLVPENPAPLADELKRLVPVVREKGSEAGLMLGGLRLVALTEDIAALTKEWQRDLGKAEAGVTAMSAGIVAGKTLTWRSHADGRSLAVVLLSARVSAESLVQALLHEFVHVHEAALRAAHCRPEVPWPRTNDILGIKHFVAEMMWGEYFAERVVAFAYRPTPEEPKQWLDVVRERHERVCELKAGWHDQQSRDSFWGDLVTEVSDSAVTIGRVLGRLSPEPDLREEFIESLAFAPRWRQFALDSAQALDAMVPGALQQPVEVGRTLAPLLEAVWDEFGVEVASDGYRIR